MIHVLNALGLDTMTVHWEYAHGPTIFMKRAAELKFPILATNISFQFMKITDFMIGYYNLKSVLPRKNF